MQYKRMTALLFIICVPQAVHAKFSLKNPFKNNTHEETIQKEYALSKGGTLEIENLRGNIHIKPEWDRNTILLSATKTATTPEQLSAMSIASEQPCATKLMLRTAYDQNVVQGSMDYTLIIPMHVTLHVKTYTGDISVTGVSGPIYAATNDGAIELHSINNSVEAIANKTGSIVVAQTSGMSNAKTSKGNITIVDPKKNVRAATGRGNIDVYCQQAPASSQLLLNADSGNIDLHLPQSTNAEILAKAEKGKVLCEHVLTLKPYSTKLDNKAWAQFKREVNGVLGRDVVNTNQVKLYAKNGTINIRESKAV